MQPRKRILSVTIHHAIDENPDTSCMGEYAGHSTSKFSIDRAHSEDCASIREDIRAAKLTLEHVQQTLGDIQKPVPFSEEETSEYQSLENAYREVEGIADDIAECDCGEHGDMEHGEYRYFNPSFNYVDKNDKLEDGLTPEDVRKYVRQDYDRLERLKRGHWFYIGIYADAQVILQTISDGGKKWHGTTQKIGSGGLWGIESDSDKSHIAETETDQLTELKTELLAAGFSKRAISLAFKNITRKDS